MPEKSDDSHMSPPSAEFEKIIAERDELKHQNSYDEAWQHCPCADPHG